MFLSLSGRGLQLFGEFLQRPVNQLFFAILYGTIQRSGHLILQMSAKLVYQAFLLLGDHSRCCFGNELLNVLV